MITFGIKLNNFGSIWVWNDPFGSKCHIPLCQSPVCPPPSLVFLWYICGCCWEVMVCKRREEDIMNYYVSRLGIIIPFHRIFISSVKVTRTGKGLTNSTFWFGRRSKTSLANARVKLHSQVHFGLLNRIWYPIHTSKKNLYY